MLTKVLTETLTGTQIQHPVAMAPLAAAPVDSGVFNAQPDISEISEGIAVSRRYQSDKYTFMLPHKHFDLESGEALWVERTEDGWRTCVKRFKDMPVESLPCMWLYNDGWVPYGYTRKKDGSVERPDVAMKDCSLGMRWLNCGGMEDTDELRRTQTMTKRSHPPKASDVITIINWMETNSMCIGCICYCGTCNTPRCGGSTS